MRAQAETTKPATGHLALIGHGTRMRLTFTHTTGSLGFYHVGEAGEWIRKHGGRLGRITGEGPARRREAIFEKTNKLPKWAQP